MRLRLQSILDSLGERASIPFALVGPEGSTCRNGTDDPRFTLHFKSDAAVLATAMRGHMGLLESYFDQSVDLQGDLGAAFAAAMASGFDRRPNPLAMVENNLHEFRHSNRSWDRAKENARFHYGLGEPFYRAWLDELKMYTCAYWREGTQTLEEAQANKIDHVIRKVRLAPGERYVDIGCGFGGFMFRALETVGAQGVGLNNTTEQVDWLRDEIARRGLQQQLAVREADFRDVDTQYDKVISIGTLEHAGRDQVAEVVKAHADFLKPGGIGMLHFIGHVGHRQTELFIRKFVFPGGWIPSLAEVIAEMERSGLEILDIENLRRHYALTLDEWARRFDRNWDAIHALDPRKFDERFRRIWRCYLIGCAEMFRAATGFTHLFQITFSKGNVKPGAYPMSRSHVYER